MSDSDDGPSDVQSDDSVLYDGSEGDQDEIARELDDEADQRSEDPDERDSSDIDEDEDGTPEDPVQDTPGPYSAQPSTTSAEVAGISPIVLIVLRAAYTTWKAERGNKRKSVWRGLLKELRALPENNFLLESQWDLRSQVYLRWMQRQGHKQPKKTGFFTAPKWTIRNVVRKLKDKRITEILHNVYGVAMGSSGMLEHYQKALTQAIEEMSTTEMQEMQKKVEEWNEQTEPDSVKARFATRGMGSVMKEFAEAMWKRGGVRMVILTGYKDEENSWLTTSFDFNKDIDNGPTFHDVKTVQGPWDRYIRRCLRTDADSEELSDDEEGLKVTSGAHKQKPRQTLGSGAALQLITADDGRIWIPELLGRNRSELQALVRAYLTAHYRKVCRNPKISAPFNKLAQFQDRLFLAEHLPDDFSFPGDPSHMRASEVKDFLDFIRDRQKKFPNDVFAFQYRVNREGKLEDPVEDSDASDAEAPVPKRKQQRIKVPKPNRPQKGNQYTGAEFTDEDGDKDSHRGRPVSAVPRRQNPAPTQTSHLPREDDDLPRDLEENSTDRRESQVISKSAKGKGKQISRPKATEVIRAVTRNIPLPVVEGSTEHDDLSTAGSKAKNDDLRQPVKNTKRKSKTGGLPIGDKSVPNDPSARSVKIGPSKGKQATVPTLPSQTSTTSVKIGPPIGAKRTEVSKATLLPKKHSVPRLKVQTTAIVTDPEARYADEADSHRAFKEVPIVPSTMPRSRPESAGQTAERRRSGPLKSALKGSTARQSDEPDNVGKLANTERQLSRRSHDASRSIHPSNRSSNGPASKASTPTPADVDNNLEPLTPRRSNRERRAPARVDDEEPNPKRKGESGPLTSQFKTKRARFD